MPTEPSTSISKSGITTSSTGERHIPSSTRADGSVRKEIRVRPGYRPPEDVEVYRNRTAEAWKNRGKGGVPGADPAEEKAGSEAAGKNAKRREARKKAAEKKKEEGGAEDGEVKKEEKVVVEEKVEEIDPEEQKAKEAKKLAKKLRQAKDLKEKKENGDKLLPEQFEKVIKISELMRQLEKLGFDSNGEKKEDVTKPAEG